MCIYSKVALLFISIINFANNLMGLSLLTNWPLMNLYFLFNLSLFTALDFLLRFNDFISVQVKQTKLSRICLVINLHHKCRFVPRILKNWEGKKKIKGPLEYHAKENGPKKKEREKSWGVERGLRGAERVS